MKITMLIDNISQGQLKAKHGLSMYIETEKNKILFDLGRDNTLFKNAKLKNINLEDVDIVVISHGHMDHGGALKEFLEINKKAKVYIQTFAFDVHYSKFLFFKINIGLDKKYANHPQVVLVNGDYNINEEMSLFIVKNREHLNSPANNVLFGEKGVDDFYHEQNLVITEKNKSVLITGCSHSGIANIIDRAKSYNPCICIGGFHMVNPFTKRLTSKIYIDEVVKLLKEQEKVKFYTCHCTSIKGYEVLSKRSDNLFYIACGDTLEI